MDPQNFAARLRELREAAGLTQAALAEKCQLSHYAVAQWEQGRREPSWGNVFALAVALGVDCTAFTKEPSTDPPPAKRGRPRKEESPGAKPEAKKRMSKPKES